MTAPDWLDQTFRWGQVNFNERDPQTLDVEWWSRYWAECRLQGMTLNVGGPMAFYPTDVPLHERSPFLGDRDLLGDTVAAAKALGMRVLGRLDPSFATRQICEAHPDWCLTQADGTPFTFAALVAGFLGRARPAPTPTDSEPLYLGCTNSPYFKEFVLEIATEVLERYDLDGIWTNGWPGVPLAPGTMCHCPHCLEAWAGEHPGRPRPQRADAADPEWRAYVDFAVAQVEDRQRLFRDHIAAIRPQAIFLSSANTSPGTPLRWGRWVDLVDALGIDAQARPALGTEPARAPALWGVGLQSELSRAVARGKPMIRFVATYMGDQPVFRHAARPPLETRLQMAQALAHGERPKWHTLGGQSHDRRWMPALRELDEWMAAHDHHLRNVEPVSDVGVVWSPRSVQLEAWRQPPGPSHRDALIGWYAALMEARIPFEYVHEDHLSSLDRFKVLVLPTGLGLPKAALAAIQTFAEAGGGVVACCGALGMDEWGDALSQDSISRLLGVRYTGPGIGPLSHSCIGIGEPAALLAGLGDTDIVGGGRWIVPFAPADPAGTRTEGAWIPDYPVHPTHTVVLPEARQDVPLCASTAGSAGAPAVYLAADLDAAYGRQGYPDHGRILGNAIAHALAGRPPSVEVHGAGIVDVRPWRQPGRRSVFLVNLDNSMLQGGMVRELRAVGPLEVLIRLGREEQPTGVRLLRQDAECDWRRQAADTIVATVPQIDDFEVVAVELAGAGRA